MKQLESSGVVAKWLGLPEAQQIEHLDDASTTELHRQIIWKKPFLRRLYLDFYEEFKRAIQPQPTGLFVELGSGGGFLKRAMPPVITSNLLPLSDIDLCFTGHQIPFKNHSIDAFFMLNVLHHVKDPVAFFKELARCLRRLGKIVMIEPANTLWRSFVWRNFHHEGFDESADWRIEGSGRLSSANIALP